MKISLVITLLNEEATVDWLLTGLVDQTLPPAEIIIVDGGSTDGTVKIIRQWQKKHGFGKKIILLRKKGNRSVGRNHGIQQARHPWIAVTDAGCIPEANWLAELAATQQHSGASVVAGYYYGLPRTRLEQAIVPYALVMPPRVNPNTFLPAARSMLWHRSVWKQLGGFDPRLNHNEDYALARQMQKASIPIAFAPAALVGWLPRKTLSEFWQMISRFARGDAQAGLMRPKVLLIFVRYVLFWGWLFLLAVNSLWSEVLTFGLLLTMLYSYWAMMKNKRFAPRGWAWLPILQIISDYAVMAGTTQGLMEKRQFRVPYSS